MEDAHASRQKCVRVLQAEQKYQCMHAACVLMLDNNHQGRLLPSDILVLLGSTANMRSSCTAAHFGGASHAAKDLPAHGHGALSKCASIAHCAEGGCPAHKATARQRWEGLHPQRQSGEADNTVLTNIS